jgi:SAM-dependent methyltransferase
MSVFERMTERYQKQEDLSWDDPLPPPEVREVAAGLPVGRALDLGCGYGRAAIYLAQLGWQVDGVDFIELAIAEARRRAEAAGVTVRFHVSSVTSMPFLTAQYDLAVDVGCMHSLDAAGLVAYESELRRLLRPGATYLLFARLREGLAGEENKPGIEEARLRALFAQDWQLERVEYGRTRVAEDSEWASGWFWWQRRDA